LNLYFFVMNNINGSTYIGTVHQHFDMCRRLEDRVRLRLITGNLLPHLCTYQMIKYRLFIGCGISRDYLSGKPFVGLRS